MEIPERLEEWIVAYHRISDWMYHFYCRGLPFQSFGIKAVKCDTNGHFRGEVRIELKDSVHASLSIPGSFSETPNETIQKALQIFIESSLNGH